MKVRPIIQLSKTMSTIQWSFYISRIGQARVYIQASTLIELFENLLPYFV